MARLEFSDWLQIGMSQGWCGPSVCAMHDGIPMSEEEEVGDAEPCVHIIRLYEDHDVKEAVEEYHSPSVWRATNSGFEL